MCVSVLMPLVYHSSPACHDPTLVLAFTGSGWAYITLHGNPDHTLQSVPISLPPPSLLPPSPVRPPPSFFPGCRVADAVHYRRIGPCRYQTPSRPIPPFRSILPCSKVNKRSQTDRLTVLHIIITGAVHCAACSVQYGMWCRLDCTSDVSHPSSASSSTSHFNWRPRQHCRADDG